MWRLVNTSNIVRALSVVVRTTLPSTTTATPSASRLTVATGPRVWTDREEKMLFVLMAVLMMYPALKYLASWLVLQRL